MEITTVGFWYYFICYTGMSVFMFFVGRHVLLDREPCGVYLRNAYDKINYIYTADNMDLWDINGLYHTWLKHLSTLDYYKNSPSAKNVDFVKYYPIIYSHYRDYMAHLFVNQRLRFDRNRAKLSDFDYFIDTFTSYLEIYQFKERLENNYLLAGETIDIDYYKKHEEDGYYELSEFGKVYYSLLHRACYYLQYQDEKICKKKKLVKASIEIPNYTGKLQTIKEILETNKIKKDWTR
jgi:hypothetical protein